MKIDSIDELIAIKKNRLERLDTIIKALESGISISTNFQYSLSIEEQKKYAKLGKFLYILDIKNYEQLN